MAKSPTDAAVSEFAASIGMLVRRLRAAAATQELSWTETAVLKRLATGGPSTTADLARAQGMKPQSMGTVVGSLEQMGMVQRRPHPTDGRQMHIVLTSSGEAANRSAGEAKRTWLADAFGYLDQREQQTLLAAGQILRRMVER
jgi:DNA-binding MarR family transcriptional regulator